MAICYSLNVIHRLERYKRIILIFISIFSDQKNKKLDQKNFGMYLFIITLHIN